MNIISIKLLESLVDGEKKPDELSKLLQIKGRWLAKIIKNLTKEDYIEKKGAVIRLKETPKAVLFRDIAQSVDVEKLLYESNETILSSMDLDITVDELIKKIRIIKGDDLQVNIGFTVNRGHHKKRGRDKHG